MNDISPAVVLAAFGTTDMAAMQNILNIKNMVASAFPEAEVRLALTSAFVRRHWRRLAARPGFAAGHPEIPAEILHAAGPLSVLADLADSGPRPMVLQSLHVAEGKEFSDLNLLVEQLTAMRGAKGAPFPDLRLGEPALGNGSFPYLRRMAAGLTPLVKEAGKRKAALVLVGHGGENAPAQTYIELEAVMRQMYGPDIHIGLIEGKPGVDDILASMISEPAKPRRVFMAPLLLVAGSHAQKDMAGEDGWANRFRAAGFTVEMFPGSLSSFYFFNSIFIEHIEKIFTRHPA